MNGQERNVSRPKPSTSALPTLDLLGHREVFKNNSFSMALRYLLKPAPITATDGSKCTPAWRVFSVLLEMKPGERDMRVQWAGGEGTFHSHDSLMFHVRERKQSAKRATSRSKATRKKSSKPR